jgi:hypothetical protein
MRALVGAIITAGALIGLGLTAMGVGARYASHIHYKGDAGGAVAGAPREVDWEGSSVRIRDMDNALKLILTLLCLMGLIGLGITFLGLAYHHERRLREWHHLHGGGTGNTPRPPESRVTV